ncbi:hypothetical protein AGMMS49957_06970 [Synergistales bacterium]|nr:hypothetical protein AGMMS49957_06970 [Synergistales bacterium]
MYMWTRSGLCAALFFVLAIFVWLGFPVDARATPVLGAYQKMYGMNFEIYRPEEASWPLGWYATFDGYATSQVEANHWVYGRVGLGGV